jgi:hypothetical protein
MILTAAQMQGYLDRIEQLEAELIAVRAPIEATDEEFDIWMTLRKHIFTLESERDQFQKLFEDAFEKLTTSRAEIAAIVQLAANKLQGWKDQYESEHGQVDRETNVWEANELEQQYCETLQESIDAILALAKLPHRLALEERVAEDVLKQLGVCNSWHRSDLDYREPNALHIPVHCYECRMYDTAISAARANLARIKRERE